MEAANWVEASDLTGCGKMLWKRVLRGHGFNRAISNV